MEITEQPVETGAKITDHSYVRPASLTIHCGWSNSQVVAPLIPGITAGLPESIAGAFTGTVNGAGSILTGNAVSQVKKIYQDLLNLQSSRVPFEVITGKRRYVNMLIKSLKTTTNKETENSLMVTATFQEIKMVVVNTMMVTTPTEAQAYPEVTDKYKIEGTKSLAPSSTYRALTGGR